MRLANIMLLLILTSGLTGFPGRVLACSEVFSSSSQNPDLPSMRDVQLSILQTLTLLRHKAYIQNDRVRLSSEDMNEPTEVRAVIKLQSLQSVVSICNDRCIYSRNNDIVNCRFNVKP